MEYVIGGSAHSICSHACSGSDSPCNNHEAGKNRRNRDTQNPERILQKTDKRHAPAERKHLRYRRIQLRTYQSGRHKGSQAGPKFLHDRAPEWQTAGTFGKERPVVLQRQRKTDPKRKLKHPHFLHGSRNPRNLRSRRKSKSVHVKAVPDRRSGDAGHRRKCDNRLRWPDRNSHTPPEERNR